METQENLLAEIEFENQFVNASPGQRFANFILDIVGVFILSFLLSFLAMIPIEIIAEKSPGPSKDNMVQLVLLFSYVLVGPLLYYTFFEKITKGRTLGKLITKTRVVKENGERLSFKDTFVRAVIRFIPLEIISLWFNEVPWHDQWTRTRVVKK
jgi:uncharacterized RDD family membrane protein YckC